MRDSETGLTWEDVDFLFEVNVDMGSIKWKNPTCNRAKFLKGKEAGCHKHSLGYVNIYINRKSYKRHRLIWFYANKRWPELDIDHIDGSKSNDIISNLREATKSQNLRNSKISKNNTSGVKGVAWDKIRKKWRAKIKAGNEVYLGRFSTKDEAISARFLAEQQYHGRFARGAA